MEEEKATEELLGKVNVEIQDSDEEEQDTMCEPVSDNSSEQMSSFVTNALIMDKIFGYLDVKELKVCKFICKEWSEMANSILNKENDGNGLAVNLDVAVKMFENIYYKNSENEKERIEELYSVVEAAPIGWFKTANLHNNCCCLDRHEFTSVLKDFGYQLKTIKITSPSLNMHGLRSILMDWCPNLEQLSLNGIRLRLNQNDCELNIPPSRCLKLTQLSFRMNATKSNSMFDLNISKVLIEIIKHSANLKTLDLDSISCCSACDASGHVTATLFSELKGCHEMMENLEQIVLENCKDGGLEALSKIQFKSKIKILYLTNIQQQQALALSRLLDMTNEPLEKLTLHSYGPYIDLNDQIFELKQMNNLQEFRYLANPKLLMGSIDILANMPNLKTLMLSDDEGYSFRYRREPLMNNWIDSLFSNCWQLMKIPHNSLKELYLFGFIKNPYYTLEVINRVFPNLEKLVVGIYEPENIKRFDVVDVDKRKSYFDKAFLGISQMQCLKTLFLQLVDFRDNQQVDVELEMFGLRASFFHLKDLPNLVRLTISDASIEDLQEHVIGLLKLRRLTLIGMKIDQIQVLVQTLSERGVLVDTMHEPLRKDYKEKAYGFKIPKIDPGR